MNHALLKKYSDSLKKYGADSPMALLWGTKETQYLRFKILSEIGDIWDDRILDYGCGVGDLYQWLKEHGFRGGYQGYDTNKQMMRAAKKKYPQADFALSGQVKPYDWAFLSGLFNDKESTPWTTLIPQVWRDAKKGVAFNFNNDESVFLEELFAELELTTQSFVIRRDYRGENMTIYLYKHKGVKW